MPAITLNQTANMLTVTLPRGASQDMIEAAIDHVNAHVEPGVEGTFLDFGDIKVWQFPLAA